MTKPPEASLARELAVCSTSVGLATYRRRRHRRPRRSMLMVFAESTERLWSLALDVVSKLPAEWACACTRNHAGTQLPFP